MLLLSRKKIHIGLCCGKCWLKVGDFQIERVTEIDNGVDIASLQNFFVQALTSMLVEAKEKIKAGSLVQITVSDRLAMIATLRWQDTAMSRGELENFSIFWLAKCGMKIDESHLLFADYPRYRSIGIAYALPKVLVESVAEVLINNNLKLARVLPVSATVFFSDQFRKVYPSSVTVCEETHALSAWVSDHESEIHYEVEPVTATPNQAMDRLLARVCVRYSEFERIDYWSLSSHQDIRGLRDRFPFVKLVNVLERECWAKS